jgi:hypothetical protein
MGARKLKDKESGDPRFLALLDEMAKVHRKKSADYGLGDSPLANLRASAEFGVPPWKATIIRLNDKVTRLKAFCQNGTLHNEGVEDSLVDISNYALGLDPLPRRGRGPSLGPRAPVRPPASPTPR